MTALLKSGIRVRFDREGKNDERTSTFYKSSDVTFAGMRAKRGLK